MRPLLHLTIPMVAALLLACDRAGSRPASGAGTPAADTAALGDTLRGLIVNAWDLTRADAVDRIMRLYPSNGPVVSASAGQITTSRDSLRAQIDRFYQWIGQNMRQPRWEWVQSHVEVLGPDAAVLSAVYRIPHETPEGRPHAIGGAWTMVFERRDGRWVIVHEHLSDRPAQ